MDDLRSMIREVLAEELRALKVSLADDSIQREQVSFASDHDLNGFVRRIVQMAADPAKRDAILSGRHVFALGASSGAAPAPQYIPPSVARAPAPSVIPSPIAHSAPAPAAHVPRQQFTKGLLTEKDVGALPKGTRVISVGKSVRFTPLARDELRRLNIKIERTAA